MTKKEKRIETLKDLLVDLLFEEPQDLARIDAVLAELECLEPPPNFSVAEMQARFWAHYVRRMTPEERQKLLAEPQEPC